MIMDGIEVVRMQYKTFMLSVSPCTQNEEALNIFLRTHKIISVRTEFASTPPQSWCILVEYVQDFGEVPYQNQKKIDYRELLPPEEFAYFSKLREMRKRISAEQHLLPFTVFTDAQLVEIVKQKVSSVEKLSAVTGVGQVKAEKFGGEVLKVMNGIDKMQVQKRRAGLVKKLVREKKMKRISACFEKITDIQNLHLAFYKAAKHKRSTSAYLYFRQKDTQNIAQLKATLLSGDYKPANYKQFFICDPKKRLISVDRFPDRIVHHAIMNILEPVFEKRQIYASFACRKGKGTHRATLYAFNCGRRIKYFLKLDVRKYFDSIKHDILKTKLSCILKDKKTLSLLFGIIDSYNLANKHEMPRGLPIGNLTSQFFANEYLCALDHFVLETLKPEAYVRYMDDMVLYSNDLTFLKNAFLKMSNYVDTKLFCNLKLPIFGQVKNGVPFLGWLITNKEIRLLRKSKKRSQKTIYRINNLACLGFISEQEALTRIETVHAVRRCTIRNR